MSKSYREKIDARFQELIEHVKTCERQRENTADRSIPTDIYYKARTGALSLISSIAGPDCIYIREIETMQVFPKMLLGTIEAAHEDFLLGLLGDRRSMVSAEVLSSFLDHVAELLANEFKDPAAVILRAILEDGLRRICQKHSVDYRDRETLDGLSKMLVRESVLSKIEKNEIDAKRSIGNAAAHGRFGEYSHEDVVAFEDFVKRFLSKHL